MNAKSLWCAICNRMVEEGASAMIAPLVGGTAGGAIGKAKGGWEHAIAGALLGVLAGVAVHAMIPKAQCIVCRDFGGHVG